MFQLNKNLIITFFYSYVPYIKRIEKKTIQFLTCPGIKAKVDLNILHLKLYKSVTIIYITITKKT